MVDYRTLQMQTPETNDQVNAVHVYEMTGVNGSNLSTWDTSAALLDKNLVTLDNKSGALAAFLATDVDNYPAHINAADSLVASGSVFFQPFVQVSQYVWDFWLYVPSSAILRDVDLNNESGAVYMGNSDGVMSLVDEWDSYNDIYETAQTGQMNSGRGLKIGKGLKRFRFYILQTGGDVGVNLEISYDKGLTYAPINPNWVFNAAPTLANEAVNIDDTGAITKVSDGSAVVPSDFVSLNNFDLDWGWFGEPDALELYHMLYSRTSASIDLFVDQGSNELVVIEDAHAVAQHTGQRISTFYGEWFLDTEIGVQWLEEVMAKYDRKGVIIAEQLLRSEILGTPGVADIHEINLAFDRAKRAVETKSLFILTDFDQVIDVNSPF